MTRNRPSLRAASGPRAATLACLLALLLMPGAPRAQAFDPGRPEIAGFIADLAHRHDFEPGPLADLLAEAQSRPAILQAISKPAERVLRWDEYRPRFVVDQRVRRGVAVEAERRAELERAQASTGVPAEIMLGIVGVETIYGQNTGRYRVVDALATLAFDYPPRAPYFRGELEQFLLMTREERLDPLQPLGSYAGAMGIPQFMPTSFRKWAVDGDGDGRRDLWGSWADVFASVGNYLEVHGWRKGEPVMVPADASGADLEGLDTTLELTETVASLRRRGVKFETTLPASAPARLVALAVADGTEYRVGFNNFRVLTRYNRSQMYASAVHDLATAIAASRSAATSPAPPATPDESAGAPAAADATPTPAL